MLFPLIAFLVVLAPLAASLATGLSKGRISPLVYRIATLGHVAAFAGSIPLLVRVAGADDPTIRISLLSSSFDFFSLGLTIDRLSAVMMVLITGIGAIIHLYSIRFMQQERGVARFHGLLSLAISVLLFMVSSSTLVMLFAFWQLLTFLLSLLAYNYAHPPTAQGSFRTFIMLRAGDIFFLAGIVLAYHLYGTVDFRQLFLRAATNQTIFSLPAPFFGENPLFSIHANTLLTLLIFVGAMSKSAQFPLHMWLPDSLYAPTPVHALLHAGIINAGGFLLNRLAPLYGQSPATLHAVFAIGLLTALLGASMMLTQNDIKKTLGYSTIGQMGYMIMECGLGAFALAVFHLIAHGLFKATIFLNCGNVIHSARLDQRRPIPEEMEEIPTFSLLTWTTGLVTTLILPLIILLSLHGVLAIPASDSKGEIIFLFFSWITSAQAILTLYRLRALGSFKAAAMMLLTLGLVMATYLVAVKRFVFFLYPDPDTVSTYFKAAALPAPLFNTLIAVGALFIFIYWISVFTKSHGRPDWMTASERHLAQDKVAIWTQTLRARFYLLFMNRLYLDALSLSVTGKLRKVAMRLDRSRLFLPLLALLGAAGTLPFLEHLGGAPSETLFLFFAVALLLPLFPFHGLYLAALTRPSRTLGPLPALLAIFLPALGVYTAHSAFPHMTPEIWVAIRPLALIGAIYGSVKAIVQTRPLLILGYASLSFYSILWWHLSWNGHLTFSTMLFAGSSAWATGGLALAWEQIRKRYGDIELTRIGGLAYPMPRLAFLSAFVVMAAAGLPPFGLFSGYLAILLDPSHSPGPSTGGGYLPGLLILFAVWFMASWILYRLMQRLFFGPYRPDIPYEDLSPWEAAPLVVVILVLLFFSLLPYGCPNMDRGAGCGGGAINTAGLLWNR